MDQGAARRRAKELGGIAVSARKGSTGKWLTGGWPSDNEVWIVVSLNWRHVLDDGDGPVQGPPVDLDKGAYETLDRLMMFHQGTAPSTQVYHRSKDILMDLVERGFVEPAANSCIRITDAGRAAWKACNG